MLYSVGKDSSVMFRLVQKAFYPAGIPFPLLHIDTGFKFREILDFRNRVAKKTGARIIVHRNEAAIAAGTNPADMGTVRCCHELKTGALLSALKEGGYDAVLGGAQRDEEKSRAKERIYSFRDKNGRWDPCVLAFGFSGTAFHFEVFISDDSPRFQLKGGVYIFYSLDLFATRGPLGKRR